MFFGLPQGGGVPQTWAGRFLGYYFYTWYLVGFWFTVLCTSLVSDIGVPLLGALLIAISTLTRLCSLQLEVRNAQCMYVYRRLLKQELMKFSNNLYLAVQFLDEVVVTVFSNFSATPLPQALPGNLDWFQIYLLHKFCQKYPQVL